VIILVWQFGRFGIFPNLKIKKMFLMAHTLISGRLKVVENKKAVLSQGNRAMPQLLFLV